MNEIYTQACNGTDLPFMYIYIYKVNQSRYRPGVAQRVPGS